MKRSLRSEAVSIHLERHREFLERHGIEHADAGNVADADLPRLDAHGGPATVLPFERDAED